jgi:hypothetical protein
MYEIRQELASPAFVAACEAAGRHLQRMGGDGVFWLGTDLLPPVAEHLSFRLGNQLVFVFVEAPGVPGPSSLELFLDVAREATAIPAIMPVQRAGGEFRPAIGGWGLQDARTGQPVDPGALVSDERIEMSDWEIHDAATQFVAAELEKSGCGVLSRHSSFRFDPAIWFRDDRGPAFVVVRSGRFPLDNAPRPRHLDAIVAGCAAKSGRGYFASVTLAHVDQVTSSSPKSLPLYRGHGMVVRFPGLEAI